MPEIPSSDDEIILPEGKLLDEGNPALADAMKKVLSIGRNAQKSSLVLAKAKVNTDSWKQKKSEPQHNFEVLAPDGSVKVEAEVKDDEDIKPDATIIRKRRIKKQEVAARGRVKPSALDREKERPLVKIATRGVVQLFNAVREQQKIIDKKLDDAGPLHSKKEKAMKTINRQSFLEVLRSCSDTKSRSVPSSEIKSEDEEETEPTWSVLRDDYMMGANPKDWDRNAEDDQQTKTTPPKRPRTRQ